MPLIGRSGTLDMFDNASEINLSVPIGLAPVGFITIAMGQSAKMILRGVREEAVTSLRREQHAALRHELKSEPAPATQGTA